MMENTFPGEGNDDEHGLSSPPLPHHAPAPSPPSPPSFPPRSPSSSSWRRVRVHTVLPFVATALVSILLTLVIQFALPIHRISPRLQSGMQNPTSIGPSQIITPLPGLPDTSMGTDTREPVRIAPTRPPGILLLSDEEMSYEILQLRSELQDLWGAYYLARAAMLLADAETALRINDQAEIERLLMTAAVSLDMAYEQSAEQEKGPIREFRTQVAVLYEELAIRPEHMDIRIRRLRQTMLTLMSRG